MFTKTMTRTCSLPCSPFIVYLIQLIEEILPQEATCYSVIGLTKIEWLIVKSFTQVTAHGQYSDFALSVCKERKLSMFEKSFQNIVKYHKYTSTKDITVHNKVLWYLYKLQHKDCYSLQLSHLYTISPLHWLYLTHSYNIVKERFPCLSGDCFHQVSLYIYL